MCIATAGMYRFWIWQDYAPSVARRFVGDASTPHSEDDKMPEGHRRCGSIMWYPRSCLWMSKCRCRIAYGTNRGQSRIVESCCHCAANSRTVYRNGIQVTLSIERASSPTAYGVQNTAGHLPYRRSHNAKVQEWSRILQRHQRPVVAS